MLGNYQSYAQIGGLIHAAGNPDSRLSFLADFVLHGALN
jgi:hypothetical protein